MKKVAAFLILLLLAGTFAVDARPHHRPPRPCPPQGGGGIGAPLDGGLLTVLGVAGVAYVMSRKKKRDPEA